MRAHSEKIAKQLADLTPWRRFRWWLSQTWPALLAWALVILLCGIFVAFVAWASKIAA